MFKALQKQVSNLMKEKPEMAQEEILVELATETFTTELATAQAALAEKVTELSALTEQLTALSAELATAQEQLAIADEAKEQLVQAAHEAKLVARKNMIVASIGTDKADALMTATEGLDDIAFASVVGALAGSVVAEAKTDLFVEVGVTAEVDTINVVAEAPEMALIRKQFNVK